MATKIEVLEAITEVLNNLNKINLVTSPLFIREQYATILRYYLNHHSLDSEQDKEINSKLEKFLNIINYLEGNTTVN